MTGRKSPSGTENAGGQSASERILAEARPIIEQLRIGVTETADGAFEIQIEDDHTFEVAKRVAGGDWQRCIVSALANGLKKLKEMQAPERQAEASVDGPATRITGPRRIRVRIQNPHAMAGIDRLAARTGTDRAQVVGSTVRAALAICQTLAEPGPVSEAPTRR